jgi:hypothetical protein
MVSVGSEVLGLQIHTDLYEFLLVSQVALLLHSVIILVLITYMVLNGEKIGKLFAVVLQWQAHYADVISNIPLKF